jgi:hypothetical protein
LLGKQDPSLRKIEQQHLMCMALGLLRHPQAIRYVASEIDWRAHGVFSLFSPGERYGSL